MRTKTQIQKVSGQPGSLAPEISLIAFLSAMVLLRMLDLYSPGAAINPACSPTLADRAVISCAIRPDQNLNAL
jgi:hypothetical protein